MFPVGPRRGLISAASPTFAKTTARHRVINMPGRPGAGARSCETVAVSSLGSLGSAGMLLRGSQGFWGPWGPQNRSRRLIWISLVPLKYQRD